MFGWKRNNDAGTRRRFVNFLPLPSRGAFRNAKLINRKPERLKRAGYVNLKSVVPLQRPGRRKMKSIRAVLPAAD